ncbi:alpha/beta hydrolase family protein [Micromonospora sp. DT81.3]|uniref:alpha/beta hydrolase family protein n=1 Tax=Micromonospora sp. DT81.3 TaxID=3416523 RepID=UPI003CE7F125
MPESSLRVGGRASWSGIYFRDPDDAGLAAEEVSISTSYGPAPAWLIRSSHGGHVGWAIHIHGLASPRAGTLRGVQVVAEMGFDSLVVTYRNDGEGSTVGAGRSTLGARETDDVRAAVRFAVDQGAQRIVLFGWSMGAAIALQLAAESEFKGVVGALVIDSPVLDWTATINANCARAGLPSWVGILARPWLRRRALAAVVGLDGPIPLDRFNWIERAVDLSVPTLILHGSDDRSAPIALSRRLAALRPDTVRLETFASDHTMPWNSDPQRWQSVVGDWLVHVRTA